MIYTDAANNNTDANTTYYLADTTSNDITFILSANQADYYPGLEFNFKKLVSPNRVFLNAGASTIDGSSSTPATKMIFHNRKSDGNVHEVLTIEATGRMTTAGDVLPGADVILANGRGISFTNMPNESGMSSELLDDYEEGTWTPVLKNGNDTITYTGGDSNFTYTKIGNVVTVNFTFNNETTAGTTGAVFSIEGLPFAAVSTQANRFIGTIVNYYNLGLYLNGWPAYAHLDAGQSKINVYYKTANNGQYNAATVSNVGSSSFMQWQITYFT